MSLAEEMNRVVQAMREVGRGSQRVAEVFEAFGLTAIPEKRRDEIELAARLAKRHVREGRLDLAREDFEWLGARL